MVNKSSYAITPFSLFTWWHHFIVTCQYVLCCYVRSRTTHTDGDVSWCRPPWSTTVLLSSLYVRSADIHNFRHVYVCLLRLAVRLACIYVRHSSILAVIVVKELIIVKHVVDSTSVSGHVLVSVATDIC